MPLRDVAADAAEPAVFDVGINQRMPVSELAMLGLQNIFGMTGMFVLPGLLGRSFNLPAEQIAYQYGMVFIVSGLVTTCTRSDCCDCPSSRPPTPATLRRCSLSVISRAAVWARPTAHSSLRL